MAALAINPPIGSSPFWLVVALVLCLAAGSALAVGGWRWWSLGREPENSFDSLEALREDTLAKLDQTACLSSDRDAAQQISTILRRFLGLASGTDADYATARRLKLAAKIHPRLFPAAELIAQLEPSCFGEAPLANRPVLLEQAKEVVESWR